MTLLIILASIGILSYLLNKIFNNTFLSVTQVVAFASLGIYLIAVLFLYYLNKAEIKEFHSLELELQKAREKGSVYQNTTLQVEVRDSNEWLENCKDWNSTIFELCIPDEIEELEPIK